MSGYVRIYRRMFGHPAFRNDAEALAFAWLVSRASWKPVAVRYKEHTIRLDRGDLTVSVRDMAEALDRPKGWVERLLSRLKNETMIGTRRATQSRTAPLVISISNYSTFQADDDTGRTRGETRDGTPGRTAAGQRPDREQLSKEVKKEESNTRARGSVLPDWVPATEWSDFVAMRSAIKKPLTQQAMALQLKKLESLKRDGHDPAEVLNLAVMNSWQGLYPPKTGTGSQPQTLGLSGQPVPPGMGP